MKVDKIEEFSQQLGSSISKVNKIKNFPSQRIISPIVWLMESLSLYLVLLLVWVPKQKITVVGISEDAYASRLIVVTCGQSYSWKIVWEKNELKCRRRGIRFWFICVKNDSSGIFFIFF